MKLRIFSFVIVSLLLTSSSITGAAALTFDLDPQINLSSNPGDSYESKLLSSGSNVFVVWKDFTSGSNNILFKKSADNGSTFGSVLTLDSGTLNSQAPQISAAGTNIYVVWQEHTSPGEIVIAKSSDSGNSFGANKTLSSLGSTSSVPQITSSSSDVYVVWQQSNNILFSDSGDSGDTFDAEVTLSSGTSSEPRLAISGSNVYTIWTEGNDISFVKSSDTGETFDAKKNLSNTGGIISKNPEIMSSGSNIYVVWKEGTDIFFTKSANSGDSFSTPIDLGDTGGSLSPNPEISFDGTNIYVVWSEKVSGSGDISFVKSADSGDSFGSKINLSSNSGESSLPKITSTGGKVSVAWQDNTSGNDEIFLISSDTNGASFGPAANISSNSGFSLEPEISMVGSSPYVVWEDTTPDGGGFARDVFFVTGTESLISVSFDKTEYTLNESAQITVNDASANTNSTGIDILTTSIQSSSDSSGFSFDLVETGIATGVFQGTITFDDITADSAIKAKAGDTITADYGAQSTTATIFPITIEVQIGGAAFANFAYGDIVNVEVEDKNSNQDSGIVEEIDVTITSITDPIGTTLTLTETGIATGIFGGTTSTLIFTNGNDEISASSSITITQTDATKNTNSTGIDISTISIQSTSDTTGISFDLVETGINTDEFSGVLLVTSSASVTNSSIEAKEGDVVSITSGLFTSNAHVTANDNTTEGISITFSSDATVTVSYLSESVTITVIDDDGSGGGGGGLVRPGLIVNALAGLPGLSSGGGGSPAASLNNLLTSRAVDVPEEIKEMVINHDSNSPLLPMDPDSFEGFDLPLVINDQGYVLGGFSNTLQTQIIKPDTPVTMKFTVYTVDKVQHFSLYTNLRDTNDSIPKSDTQILYNDGKDLKIIDPHGYFSDAIITVTEEEDSLKKYVQVDMTFAKEMETSHIITRMWDSHLRSGDTHILDAIKVESVKPEFNPIPENIDEIQVEELTVQTIPKWVKSNAEWWADEQIDDVDFVAGIQYMFNHRIMYVPNGETVNSSVTEIPDWVKNNAEWWADNDISDDDFVQAMQWLVSNGVITIE